MREGPEGRAVHSAGVQRGQEGRGAGRSGLACRTLVERSVHVFVGVFVSSQTAVLAEGKCTHSMLHKSVMLSQGERSATPSGP